MKKIVIFAILSLLALSFAKTVNVNPDKNGEPWLVGGLRKLTVKDWEKINNMPQLNFSKGTLNRELPTSVNNSLLPAFRPIFNQQGGSCGQASGVAYDFTYEMNTARGTAANTTTNQYPSHYTWNYLNNGVGDGSWYSDGWDIIKGAGCPTVADYGGSLWSGGDKRWMSGYDEHFNGLHNRITGYSNINVGTPEGLETFKQWVYDHGNGDEHGGVGCFAAGATGFTLTTLPYGTPNAGKKVITKWGTDVNHAMTFVGYDDEIRYDYNNDGQYTNDIDINGDNVVDMKDWEIGGLIMVNSWGNYWGNSGRAFVMYKLLAESSDIGGIFNSSIMVINVEPQTQPKLTLKVKVKYTARNKILLMGAISTDTLATGGNPYITFPIADYQGGNHYMQGGYTEDQKTIEYALDISSFMEVVEGNEPVKLFFMVRRNDPTNLGTGEIVSMSVMDYTNGEDNPLETICNQNNVPLNATMNIVSVVKREWAGVGIADEGNIKKGFTLKQNYPNPFNPETTISFNLQKASKINLAVFNAKGELVQNLTNANFTAGMHSIQFNATNLNSGIYYYTLSTSFGKVSKKMLLVK